MACLVRIVSLSQLESNRHLLPVEAHRKLRCYERPDQRNGHQLVEHALSYLGKFGLLKFVLLMMPKKTAAANENLIYFLYKRLLAERRLTLEQAATALKHTTSERLLTRLRNFLRYSVDPKTTKSLLDLCSGDRPPWEKVREIHRLVCSGADITGADGVTGSTPLHLAASVGDVSTVDYLTQRGVPLDESDKSGCTPLGHACHNGHLPVVYVLLRAAAERDRFDTHHRGHFTPQLPWFAAEAILKGTWGTRVPLARTEWRVGMRVEARFDEASRDALGLADTEWLELGRTRRYEGTVVECPLPEEDDAGRPLDLELGIEFDADESAPKEVITLSTASDPSGLGLRSLEAGDEFGYLAADYPRFARSTGVSVEEAGGLTSDALSIAYAGEGRSEHKLERGGADGAKEGAATAVPAHMTWAGLMTTSNDMADELGVSDLLVKPASAPDEKGCYDQRDDWVSPLKHPLQQP